MNYPYHKQREQYISSGAGREMTFIFEQKQTEHNENERYVSKNNSFVWAIILA